MTQDPRTTLARAELAWDGLKGKIEAERFVAGHIFRVGTDRAPIRSKPDPGLPFDTVMLHGEGFRAVQIADGWAWGQSLVDGYVGYVPFRRLVNSDDPEPTHRVIALGAQIYGAPKLKLPPLAALTFGARVHVRQIRDGYAEIRPDRWVPAPLIGPLGGIDTDWVDIAEMFLGAPYVWGGRSSAGLDCSALVQLARQTAGHDCPRDSDMQSDQLGKTLTKGDPAQRGDLVFWKGHVGIMQTRTKLLHANAHHMCVASEALSQAVKRIKAAGDGDVLRRARLD